MNIFSAISGQFGKAIIIGALLPATLFVGAVYLFVLPMVPWEWRIVARIEAVQPQWKLAAMAICSIIGAGLLYIFNYSIIRLYEGYPWEHGPIGRWWAARYRERIRTESDAAQEARRLANIVAEKADELDAVRFEVERDARAAYPKSENALPTRLGNVIRSFEEYPDRQYEIEAITLWPRFVAKLRPEHAAALDEAKTSFDVMLHLSFLAALMLLLFIVVTCFFPIAFASTRLFWPFAGRLVISAVLFWFFYRSSIVHAAEWGQLVRSVFDLYRWDVLQAFGFEERPRNLETERAVWHDLSLQIIYGNPYVGPVPTRYDSATIVCPQRYGLTATRSVRKVDDNTRTVVVRVDNPRDEALDVRVLETLPPGSEYIFGSANVPLSGVNPYEFRLGTLPGKQSAIVTYQILLRKS